MKSVAFLAEDGLRCGAAGVDDVEPTSYCRREEIVKNGPGFQSWATVERNLPSWELNGK